MAAPRIIPVLWGVDVDPRATQIAQAAIIFRARRHHRSGPLPTPNIIAARSLPSGPATDALIAELPGHVQRVVRAMTKELAEAPILGPLLKIEERLDHELRDVFGTGVIEGTMSEAMPSENGDIETEVFDALARIADSATSSAAQRLFAAEARDAVRFVEAMNRRYMAVLMNPPFGEPVPATKEYLKATYPWLPKFEDLLAAFVGRGVQLCLPGGTVGAITSRAGLFLQTYERWRREVLLAGRVQALADLGFGVMAQAMVEAAAYVVSTDAGDTPGVYLRLLKELDRQSAIQDLAHNSRVGIEDRRLFQATTQEIRVMPKAVFGYWMEPSLRELFRTGRTVDPALGPVKQGLATTDNFRFLRAWWEVDPANVSAEEGASVKWRPYAKGGEYSPWWSDIHLLVDWEDDGARIKEAVDAKYPYLDSKVEWVVKNQDFYFRPGLTWPTRTNSGLGMRVLPAGCIFDTKGSGVFPELADQWSALGWLRTRAIQALIDTMVSTADESSSGGQSRSYDVGLIQALPWSSVEGIGDMAEQIAQMRALRDRRDEITHHFVSPLAVPALEDCIAQLEAAAAIDALVLDALGVGEAGRRYLDDEVGPLPLSYPSSPSLDNDIARLYEMRMTDVIGELLDRKGGARYIANLTYVADRRLEVIAHGLEVSPRSIVRVVRNRGLAAPGELEDHAFRLISYLMGAAFGRWDVRVGRDPRLVESTTDLLAVPRRFSPGMLVDETGWPMTSPPDGYPVQFPADGILVDQSGHLRDVALAVTAAGVALCNTEEQLADALTELMKRPSLTSFLRNQFFRQHLATYSMSRRKAPIYWQLQVPSKIWGIWLYSPKLSREVLFGIVREAEQRLRLAEQQVGRLQRELDDGSSSRKAAAVAKDLDGEQRLAVELEAFRAEAERIANLGWEPNLDDGMVLNAAPLAELFPAWKDAKTYRDELRSGKYDWSTVARFAEAL